MELKGRRWLRFISAGVFSLCAVSLSQHKIAQELESKVTHETVQVSDVVHRLCMMQCFHSS